MPTLGILLRLEPSFLPMTTRSLPINASTQLPSMPFFPGLVIDISCWFRHPFSIVGTLFFGQCWTQFLLLRQTLLPLVRWFLNHFLINMPMTILGPLGILRLCLMPPMALRLWWWSWQELQGSLLHVALNPMGLIIQASHSPADWSTAALAPPSYLSGPKFMGGGMILLIWSIHWDLIMIPLATPLGGLRLGILSALMGDNPFILMEGRLSLLLGPLLLSSPPNQRWFNKGGFFIVLHLWHRLLVVQVLCCGLCPMWTSVLLLVCMCPYLSWFRVKGSPLRLCRKPFAQPRSSTTRKERAVFRWTKVTIQSLEKGVCYEHQIGFYETLTKPRMRVI